MRIFNLREENPVQFLGSEFWTVEKKFRYIKCKCETFFGKRHLRNSDLFKFLNFRKQSPFKQIPVVINSIRTCEKRFLKMDLTVKISEKLMSAQMKKILVVDDAEATRYAIVRTLKSEGFQVIEAARGIEALELAFSMKPDLITLDIHLPDILGFEICRRIKMNPQTGYIPVLQVSTSCVTSKDRIHGLEGGADSYLTHPFEPSVLIATVKSLLRSRDLVDELRLSNERFRVALKHAPIMTYTTDWDLRYTWVYNAPQGLSEKYFIGKTDHEVFSAEQALKLAEIKSRVLTSGEGQHITMSLTFSEQTRYYDMTLEPLRNILGDVVGLTVACIDVTERMKAEEAQGKALEEAEIANQAKTRFLSNMSHEIRTPLGVIQGFADLALDPTTSVSDRNMYLMTIKKNAYNLTKLLGEILDLSKIEAGRMEIEIGKFSLPELLNELAETFSLHAHNQGLKLKIRFDGNFPEFIHSDSTRLRQILVNLISNSLKFTVQGGIEIIAQAARGKTDNDPIRIEIRIRDTGIGLTTAQQAKIFERFVQADSSTTRKFGGTGLGLNLSKKLAHALGGDLILEKSEFDRGSIFLLTFDTKALDPQWYNSKTRHAKVSNLTAPFFQNELSGMKVLIAEDSADNQLLFSQYLKTMGATVELASDGLEALTKANKDQFDVILMDVQMPNLDGYGATQELRSSGYHRPIVALTAHALKEERERALSQGFSAYLTKPLDVRLLLETLSQYKRVHS